MPVSVCEFESHPAYFYIKKVSSYTEKLFFLPNSKVRLFLMNPCPNRQKNKDKSVKTKEARQKSQDKRIESKE